MGRAGHGDVRDGLGIVSWLVSRFRDNEDEESYFDRDSDSDDDAGAPGTGIQEILAYGDDSDDDEVGTCLVLFGTLLWHHDSECPFLPLLFQFGPRFPPSRNKPSSDRDSPDPFAKRFRPAS